MSVFLSAGNRFFIPFIFGTLSISLTFASEQIFNPVKTIEGYQLEMVRKNANQFCRWKGFRTFKNKKMESCKVPAIWHQVRVDGETQCDFELLDYVATEIDEGGKALRRTHGLTNFIYSCPGNLKDGTLVNLPSFYYCVSELTCVD